MRKYVAYQTARVNWQMGQALLPAHFYAQEHSLREELYARCAMQMAPSWGLAHLKWDDDQLRRGAVAIDELTLVLPNGMLLDVPGNASITRLDLAQTKLTETPLYVHLAGPPGSKPLVGPDDEDVDLLMQGLQLSVLPKSETSVQSFKLAELESAGGVWSVSKRYIPPSLHLTSAFFMGLLARVRAVGERFQQVIDERLKVNYLAAEAQTNAKQAVRGVWELLGLLADMQGDASPHPLTVYRVLRSFYVDVCLFHDLEPRLAEMPYRHERLAHAFEQLLEPLERQLRVPPATAPYVEFHARDGARVCRLPDTIRSPNDAFLLVEKAHVGAPFSLKGLKFASPSRLRTVRDRALGGIVFKPLSGPPFFHGLSPAVDFFALEPGAEWDSAVQERQVAFYDGPNLAELRFFLYWRDHA